MPDFNQLLPAILDALDKGYTPIPCSEGSKIAVVKWKILQLQKPTREQVLAMFHPGDAYNLAVLCRDHLTVDVDDANQLDFVIDNAGSTPSIRQTPSGGYHLDYRPRRGVAYANRIDVKGRSIDLRAPGRSYVHIPPSHNDHRVPYRWIGETDGLIPVADLPVFKVSWSRSYRRRVKHVVFSDEHGHDYSHRRRRAEAWLATVEGAVASQGGHNATMRVAGRLIQDPDFDLTPNDALALMLLWNETCDPPWSEKELRHKIDDALKHKDKYRGVYAARKRQR